MNDYKWLRVIIGDYWWLQVTMMIMDDYGDYWWLQKIIQDYNLIITDVHSDYEEWDTPRLFGR